MRGEVHLQAPGRSALGPSTLEPGEARVATGLEMVLIAIALLAPLPFGAVQDEPRLALELVGAALILPWAWLAWRHPTAIPGRLTSGGIAVLLALAAFQTAPLPDSWVERMSPRTVEVRSLGDASGDAAAAETRLLGDGVPAAPRARGLSVDPASSLGALRTGAGLAGILLAAFAVGRLRGIRRLVGAVFASATVQALYGTLSLAAGHQSIWGRPKEQFLNVATGTYVNPNHYGVLLTMGLTCGAGLVAAGLAAGRRRQGRHHWLATLLAERNSRVLLLAIMAAIAAIGIVASMSRAAIALGLGSAGLAFLATTRVAAAEGRAPRSKLARVAAIALIVLALLVPVARFGVERLADDYGAVASLWEGDNVRPRVWLDTLSIAGDFPITGSGFGTFAAIYPIYRSPEIRLFYRHAHNDFVQHLAESGLIGAAAGALLLIAWFGAIASGLRGRKGTFAVAAALAVTALLVHNLVDFNFHIPANAAIAAMLVGALQGLPCRPRD